MTRPVRQLLLYTPVLLLITTAFVFWVRSYRQTRKPGVLAICWAALLLDVAVPIGLINDIATANGSGSTWFHLLHNCITLCALFSLQLFCLYLTSDESAVQRGVRRRRALLLLALLGLIGFYLLGPAHHDLDSLASKHSDVPFLTAYLATYSTYMGLTMVDVALLSRFANRVPRPFLRIGLRLLGIASTVGLLYVVHRLGYSIATALGARPPWQEYGLTGVSTWLIMIAIVLLMLGIMLPPLGSRWESSRAVKQLGRLRGALVDIAPGVVFDHYRGHDRLRVCITEIRDVLQGHLIGYLDAAVVEDFRARALHEGHDAARAQAVGEAAVIAVALHAHRNEHPPTTVTPVIIAGTAHPSDAAEVDKLLAVAREFDTSPLVDIARQEAEDQHGTVDQ
jgi:uncharacterized protein YbjQ (UPF0145 family)